MYSENALKPAHYKAFYGTTKVVPFQNNESFQKEISNAIALQHGRVANLLTRLSNDQPTNISAVTN
jgi:hypothetical protein